MVGVVVVVVVVVVVGWWPWPWRVVVAVTALVVAIPAAMTVAPSKAFVRRWQQWQRSRANSRALSALVR